MSNYSQEALAKVRKERGDLARSYRASRQQWMDKILDCPEGPRLRALLAWAKTLRLDQADELIETIAGEAWLLAAPLDVRFVALSELDTIIIKIRERAGLPPFDDPIDGSDNAFFIIKRSLGL